MSVNVLTAEGNRGVLHSKSAFHEQPSVGCSLFTRCITPPDDNQKQKGLCPLLLSQQSHPNPQRQTYFSGGKIMSSTAKRFRSLLVTLAVVAATNIAISNANGRSGVANVPDAPRPKSGVANVPDAPRPKSGVANVPDAPRPKSGVANVPDAPRP
jgi:hypothetical protein